MTCATSLELGEEASVNCVVACVNSLQQALQTIFKISADQPRDRYEEKAQKE